MPCHAFITVELKIEEKPRPRQGMCSRGRKNQIVKVSSKNSTTTNYYYIHAYILLVYSTEWIVLRQPAALCETEEIPKAKNKNKRKQTKPSSTAYYTPCMPPTIKLKQSTTMCMLTKADKVS